MSNDSDLRQAMSNFRPPSIMDQIAAKARKREQRRKAEHAKRVAAFLASEEAKSKDPWNTGV